MVKERQPTQIHHPKYDIDSLLNCPHDLSHADEIMDYERSPSALLGKLIWAGSEDSTSDS